MQFSNSCFCCACCLFVSLSKRVRLPNTWAAAVIHLSNHTCPAGTDTGTGNELDKREQACGPHLSLVTPSLGFWSAPSVQPPPESVPSHPCSSCWGCSSGCLSAMTGDSSCLCCSSCPQVHWDPAGPVSKKELQVTWEQFRGWSTPTVDHLNPFLGLNDCEEFW